VNCQKQVGNWFVEAVRRVISTLARNWLVLILLNVLHSLCLSVRSNHSVLFKENAPLLGRPDFLILFSMLLRPGADEQLVRTLDARLSMLLLVVVGDIGESSSSTLPVLEELTSH